MIRIFIGYDEDEIAAYHVLAGSIIRRCTQPVSITPVALHQLPVYRGWSAKQSTAFAFSRFLVPWMCDFEGHAIWMDADMLCRRDPAKLWALRDEHAVQVVKMDWDPEDGTKMNGRPQSRYPRLSNGETRKLWSAMMLFNCARWEAYTPDAVNKMEGLYLHQFQGFEDGDIGALPSTWQHVVGVHDHDPHASLVHWTLGGPWWAEYAETDYAEEWFMERDRILEVT